MLFSCYNLLGDYMKKYNVIAVFNMDFSKVLMCKRTKEPYKGKYNFVGGKIENEDHLSEAYRELLEETGITNKDIELKHFMTSIYLAFNYELEVYYVFLNKNIELIEEINKLEWINLNDNFFNLDKYAGEGNVGHIIEEIKVDVSNNVWEGFKDN